MADNEQSGLYTYKALTAGRQINLLAFAYIAATLVVMDGPLLQRASTAHLTISDRSLNLDVLVTPEIPSYWTGVAGFLMMPIQEVQDFQTRFLPVYDDYSAGKPLRGAISGCALHGVCRATVQAPALLVDHCTSELHHKNFTSLMTTAQLDSFETGCML